MTYASSHNGGIGQTNLNTPGSFPHLNLLKNGQNWTYLTGGNIIPPSSLDANGYMNVFANGGAATSFNIPYQVQKTGNYVITWTGNGTVALGVTSTLVS